MRKITLIALLFAIGAASLMAALPGWVMDPYDFLDPDEYIAASGIGRSAAEAEGDAISSLAAVFGVSVDSLTEIDVSDTGISADDSYAFSANIEVSVDDLVGVSVVDSWNDGRIYYALASLDREDAADHYLSQLLWLSSFVEERYDEIAEAIGDFRAYAEARKLIPVAERLDGVRTILGVLSPQIVSSVSVIDPGKVRLLADQCRDAVSIRLEIDGDINGALKRSLATYFSVFGIDLTDGEARYVIRGGIEGYPSKAPARMVYVDYFLTLELYDTVSGETLMVFSEDGREGHRTEAQARNLISVGLDEIIRTGFAEAFREAFYGY